MRILVVGASGTIGSAVTDLLKQDKNNEVICASRHGEDVQVDIRSEESIKAMYEQVGQVDAVISTAGGAKFSPVPELTPELNATGIEDKQKGQINLVLLGMDYVKDNGSFTLTTGVMMDDPIVQGASIAMVNGAIKYFVKGAAGEMPRGIRLNSVSPNIVEESWEKLKGYFSGFTPTPAKKVATAYQKSVYQKQTGQNIPGF